MLSFNDLRFSDGNKNLIIDVAIDDLKGLESAVVDYIAIDKNVYTDNGPSLDAIIYNINKREVRLELPLTTLLIDPNQDIVFVYAVAKPDLECPAKIMGTVVNLKGIYDVMLSHIREIERSCSVPLNFIDDLLKLKAFETSIKTGNYPLAIKYWNNYITKALVGNNSNFSSNCSCYGNK